MHIQNLFNYRYLAWMWTKREIKIRYKQSLLGAAWAILQPISLMIIFTLVFSYFVKIPTDGLPYPIFAYTGLLPWTFLATAITFGVPSLVNNMGLITKIYFPKEILSITAVGASFLDFLLGFLVFFFLMVFYRMPFYWTWIWIPLLILVQIILMLGVILFASAVNVFYRDIRYMIPLTLQLWFYATPVIYPISAVPEWLKPLYALNPMTAIIDSYRRTILLGQPPSPYLIISIVISLVGLFIAYRYFKSVEWKFADMI